MKKKIFVCVIILLFIKVIVFSRAQDNDTDRTLFVSAREKDVYIELLEEELDFYKADISNRPTTQLFLERSDAVVTYDVIAESIIETGSKVYWYPQQIATVVIVVDEDKVESEILGWEDLIKSDDVVSMSSDIYDMGLFISAMNYGLFDKEYEFDKTVDILSKRYDNKKLVFNDSEAPVRIMFDFQAAKLFESENANKKIKIVVPEKTFSFKRGVISKQEIEFSSDFRKDLQDEGVITNRYSKTVSPYPGNKSYENTKFPENLKELNKEISNTRLLRDRYISKTHFYVPASGTEYVLSWVISIVIFIIWTVSVLMRSTKKDVSIALFSVGICTILWVVVRFLKWQVATDTMVNRYLWYSYYIFLLYIPFFMLWVSVSANKNAKFYFPKWMKFLAVYCFLLLVIVYTNNSHQMVFSFDKSEIFWEKKYSYNIMYFVILATFISMWISSIIILIYKCIKGPNKIIAFLPLGSVFLILVYMIMYINRSPYVFNGDMVVVTCVLILVYAESAIRTHLIPLNTKYVELFDNSKLNVSIVDSKGNAVYYAKNAEEIPPGIKEEIIDSEKSLAIKVEGDTLFRSEKITSGSVVWIEDISEITQTRKNLLTSIERVKLINEILERRAKIKEDIDSERAKAMLFDELNNEVGDRIKELYKLANELEKYKKEDNGAEYKKTLAIINLTVIYIKRRCNLMFYVDRENISSDSLAVYLSELLEVLQETGVNCASVFGISEDIQTRTSVLIYDFLFSVLLFSIEHGCEELVTTINYDNEKVVATFISNIDFWEFNPSEKLNNEINESNAVLYSKNLDDAYSLRVEILVERKGE